MARRRSVALMREESVKGAELTTAAYMNAQSAVTGLRGRDLLSTVRSVARQGFRHPFHSARHALALGGQLGRVLLGDSLYQPQPNDTRFADPTWKLNPFYRRSLQAYLSGHHRVSPGTDASECPGDARTGAHFSFALLNEP